MPAHRKEFDVNYPRRKVVVDSLRKAGGNESGKDTDDSRRYSVDTKDHGRRKRGEIPSTEPIGIFSETEADAITIEIEGHPNPETDPQNKDHPKKAVNYRCKDCGALLKLGETPCSVCGHVLEWKGIS